MSIDPGIVLLVGAGLLAFTVRGIAGAASAVVFNAALAVLLALGLLGDLTLLDGLLWIAIADMFATFVLAAIVWRQLTLEPFVLRFLVVTVPIAIVLTAFVPVIDLALLAVGLGIALVIAGSVLVAQPTVATWDERTLRRRALPAGIGAGVLSGLYGMAAPVVIIYLVRGGPDTTRFRARATVIALVFALIRVPVFVAVGAIGIDEFIAFAPTAPVVLIGLGVGIWLHPRIGVRTFRTILGVSVLLAGILLALRTVLV